MPASACPACDGEGMIVQSGLFPCRSCFGEGVIGLGGAGVSPRFHTCRKCGGGGYTLQKKETTCPRCLGSTYDRVGDMSPFDHRLHLLAEFPPERAEKPSHFWSIIFFLSGFLGLGSFGQIQAILKRLIRTGKTLGVLLLGLVLIAICVYLGFLAQQYY